MRAAVLGGTHVHELFGYVPKEGNQYQTAQALAVTSESRFRRSPWLRRRLQNLMVLLIDELGQLGAELLMALDIVLKKIRGNDAPFGGVFVIAVGDHYQNAPINMRPPYMSLLMRTYFQVLNLHQLFRAHGDADLQRLINCTRVPRMSGSAVDTVAEIIRTRCHHARSDGHSRTQCLRCGAQHHVSEERPDGTWLLPRKEAVSEARVQAFESAHTSNKRIYAAEDSYMRTGNWHPTTNQQYVGALNRNTSLLHLCHIIMGYPVSVTQNFRQSAHGGCVPNGLTGRVHDFNDTTVTITRDDGRPIVVHRETSPTVLHASGVPLRRTNFPLELAVAKSIHDSQGDTLACIKTYLDATKKHLMWSRMMLFTLFTRVRTLNDVYIVDYDESVLRQLLQHCTSWHEEVDVWIGQVDILRIRPSATASVIPDDVAFTQRTSIRMPSPGVNVVYIIESLQTGELYVGASNFFSRRIRQHNTRKCSQTMHRNDWQCVFLVFGFEGGHIGWLQARRFEGRVQHSRLDRNSRCVVPSHGGWAKWKGK